MPDLTTSTDVDAFMAAANKAAARTVLGVGEADTPTLDGLVIRDTADSFGYQITFTNGIMQITQVAILFFMLLIGSALAVDEAIQQNNTTGLVSNTIPTNFGAGKLKSNGQDVTTLTDDGLLTSLQVVSWATVHHEAVIDTSVAITFSDIPTSGYSSIQLVLTQDGGGNVITPPTYLGTAQQDFTDASVTIYDFWTYDGTTIYGRSSYQGNTTINGTLTVTQGATISGTVAAGAYTVGGVVVPTISSTSTLTNKRITARVTTITSSATPAVDTNNCDCVTITALAAAITSMTSSLGGTPVNFDQLEYRIKDNGTAMAITWGASFASGVGTLPTTTVVSKVLHVYFEWDSVQSKWICAATGSEP